MPGRDRIALMIIVGAGPRRREAQPAGRQTVVQQPCMAAISSGGRQTDGVVVHDRPPERRVPDQEAGVGGQGAVQAIQVLRRSRPVPRHSLLSASSGMPSTRASMRIR